jgi:ketosteroid isomerase-like protein
LAVQFASRAHTFLSWRNVAGVGAMLARFSARHRGEKKMAPSERDDEVRIRQLLHDHARAIAAKDAKAVHACYADDLVSYDLAPPLRLEGERALDPKDLQTWLDAWQGPLRTGSRELRIAIGGDIAYAHGLRRITGVRKSGEKIDVWFRATCGLRKWMGEWKIVHLHNSVPFYMDGSKQAATDLLP